MIKPDVILSWPRNNDYPLWREMIRKNRDRYNEIVIVFTETNQGYDYRDFVRQAMFEDHVLFSQSPYPVNGEDWRNIAVNFGLLQSLHSEWIYFTEQDFFPLDGFWEGVEMLSNGCDVIAAYDGPRMHPCSIFVKRTTLVKSKKQFGAKPPEYDHFGQLQKDLETMKDNGEILIGTLSPLVYKHMAGLSHNMTLITNGELPNHQVEYFNEYLRRCLAVPLPISPIFKEVVESYFLRAGL